MKAYFSHDEGARNDPKLVKVLMRLGQAGKGVYWDLIEMLYEQGGYLPLAEVESYAFALRTEPALVNSLVNDFGLFEQDSARFWSKTALERLEMRNEKAERRAAAGAKGGKARAEREAIAKAALEQEQSNTQAMLEQSLSPAQASKGKEIKGKETGRKEGDLPASPPVSASPSESKAELLPAAARPKTTYRPDEAPIFLAANFAAYLEQTKYRTIDKATWLLRIQRRADERGQELTNSQWMTFIDRYLDIEEREGRLVIESYQAPPKPLYEPGIIPDDPSDLWFKPTDTVAEPLPLYASN